MCPSQVTVCQYLLRSEIRTSSCFLTQSLSLACIHAAYTPILTEVLVPPDSTCFIILTHMLFRLFLFPSIFYRPHRLKEMNPFFAVHECALPSRNFSPIHLLSRIFPIVAPTAILPMDVRTSVFQAVPHGREFRPGILGGGIVVDESRYLGTPILVIPIPSERPPCSLERKPILHHLLVLRILGVSRSHPELGRLSCAARKIPTR